MGLRVSRRTVARRGPLGGTPAPLFEPVLPADGRRSRYAATRDGQRFLVNTPVVPQQAGEPVHVLVNWLAARR